MNSNEFKRLLSRQGAVFSPGKSGHLHVEMNGRRSILPMHGAGKELGKGLIEAIKKDLGLR
ncbi:MAG: type II toxin-antitoxin system HicA family toxin [Magnetococcales bacterium]|nr:type II toxin-antitoxin system HicA family toxin [Magnetococcales bacterium]